MVDFDVIIVGCGPGGSVAARTSQILGLNSIIIERGINPGDKNVSGCALSPKLWRDFDFMDQMNLPHRIAKMVTIHFVGEDNIEKTNVSFSPPVTEALNYGKSMEFLTMNVYRTDFDQWLAKMATDEGAELKTSSLMTDLLWDDNKKVKGIVLEDGTEITGKIIIGADGVISTVAKVSGLRKKWKPDQLAWMAHYDYEGDKVSIDRVIGNNALHYWYSATFPVGYTFFNMEGFHVGLGGILSMVNKNYDPHTLLNKFLDVEGIKRQIELTGGKPREYQAHMFPMIIDWENIFTDNIMLIGDAAGLACPLEAEGVYYAMLSGQIAAQVAVKAIKKGNLSRHFLKLYDIALRNSHIGEEFQIGPSVNRFVQDLAFNYEAGKWIVPLFNDTLYGLCNVAEAHITNARTLELRLQGHLDSFLEAINNDISPMVDVILADDPTKNPKIFDKIVKKIGSGILPSFARLLARISVDYQPGTLKYIIEYFIRPYLEARQKRYRFKKVLYKNKLEDLGNLAEVD
ncbi:MAG TPA: NAD(P)/FAD-dependent oxidoreductase [Candidatus Deferrimicrobium sp.]|nr:NAD(P)/FAD-dependent oxidoreductase [Candidatus Deferrimicrobium sp.]